MTAPTFVSSTATAFNTSTTPSTTGNIAVQNNDVLVAFFMMENSDSNDTPGTLVTATGSTSAWTPKQEFSSTNNASVPYVRCWTATATGTGNITLTFDRNHVGGDLFGLIVKVWRNSGGIGASNINNNGTGSGSPTVSITTTGANSALDYASDDWAAVAGTATFTASNGTPVSDVVDNTLSGANYCIYSQHVLDAGAIGAKTMGMSAPNTQRYVAAVIEVLGIASASAPDLITLRQAVKRASYW